MKTLKADAQAVGLSFARAFIAAIVATNAIDFRGTRGWDSLVLSAVIAGGNAAIHTLQSLLAPSAPTEAPKAPPAK